MYLNLSNKKPSDQNSREKLSTEKIKSCLKEVPTWLLIGDQIKKQFVFQDFKEAMRFILKVAKIAEEENHHPEILINLNKVTLSLTTHSATGLTEKDFILALKIDQIG